MSKSQLYAVIDYESFSEIELGDKRGGAPGVGAYEYSLHPSTEILCVAYRVGTINDLFWSNESDTELWAPRLGRGLPEFLDLILDENIHLVAHNAFFEQCMTRNQFGKVMYSKRDKILRATRPERWTCTMAMAQALALPAGLENLGQGLGLEHKKDKEGYVLLQKWMKPRKPTEKDPRTRHDCPEEFKRILEYCRADIAAEVELFCTLPMLSGLERETWLLDQKINFRGFHVDRKALSSAMKLVETKTETLLEKVEELSGGTVQTMNQRDRIIDLLAENGFEIENMKKATVAKAVADTRPGTLPHDFLKLRQSLGLTSLAKLPSLFRFSHSDSRARGCFSYHTASTGRFGGRGPQPQNLPKPVLRLSKYISDDTLDEIQNCDLDTLELFYGDIFELCVSSVRRMITAAPGHILRCGDFANIEARVVFWLAGDTETLDKFRSGVPLYEEQAARIFGKTLDEIKAIVKRDGKDCLERFMGKESFLGSIFQMGSPRFKKQVEDRGYEISDQLAAHTIKIFRDSYPKVPKLWWALQDASINAVNCPGRSFWVGKLRYFVEKDFLFCELPSGRRIAYYRPSIAYEPDQYGRPRAKLFFWGVCSKTKKLIQESTYGGKLCENATQAVARDICVNSMKALEAAGYRVVLHAHDEIVTEDALENIDLSMSSFFGIMSKTPAWGLDIPIAVEGWEGHRYRK